MLISWIARPFAEGWEGVEPDAIVWLDVAKVEAAFSMNRRHYVGVGGTGAGQKSRYETVGQFIQSGQDVWMLVLSLDDDGVLWFTDGRHRFAWVRDHGAGALPVATNPHGAAQLEAWFGTRLRECQICG